MGILCINKVIRGHTGIPARRPQTTVSTPREAGNPQELAKKPSSYVVRREIKHITQK